MKSQKLDNEKQLNKNPKNMGILDLIICEFDEDENEEYEALINRQK